MFSHLKFQSVTGDSLVNIKIKVFQKGICTVVLFCPCIACHFIVFLLKVEIIQLIKNVLMIGKKTTFFNFYFHLFSFCTAFNVTFVSVSCKHK